MRRVAVNVEDVCVTLRAGSTHLVANSERGIIDALNELFLELSIQDEEVRRIACNLDHDGLMLGQFGLLHGALQLFHGDDVQVDLNSAELEKSAGKHLDGISAPDPFRKIGRLQLNLKRSSLELAEVNLAERIGSRGQSLCVAPMHWIHAVGEGFSGTAPIGSGAHHGPGIGVAHELK